MPFGNDYIFLKSFISSKLLSLSNIPLSIRFFGGNFHFVDSFTIYQLWSISTINNVGQSVVLLTVYLHSNNYEIFTLSVIIIFNNNCKCICIHVCKYKLLFLNNNSHRTSIDECFVRNFKEKYLGEIGGIICLWYTFTLLKYSIILCTNFCSYFLKLKNPGSYSKSKVSLDLE